MKCKECGSRIDPVMERCPQCGAEIEQVEEAAKTSGKGLKLFKTAVSVILVLTLLCAMVLVIWKDDLVPGYWLSSLPGSIPADGVSGTVTGEGTYTASRLGLKRNNDTVVAQLGDEVLTNGHLAILYVAVKDNIMGGYSDLSSIKLDASLPLDRQICFFDETKTWQQYILQEALEQWKLNALLCQKAKAANFELTEEKQQSLNNQYNQLHKDYVESGMYASVESLLEELYGPGCTYEDYLTYSTTSAIASAYYNQMIKDGEGTVTEEEIEAFYEEQKEYLAKYDVAKGDDSIVVDVRHILITVKQVTSKEEHIEERDWEATRVYAQGILDQWLAGEATEESFAALAEEHTADRGSMNTGGLYTDVKKGQMVEEFDKWCFDASRQVGDYGLVRTDYGYHLMYFVDSEEYWHYVCAANVPTWRVNTLLQSERDTVDMQINYNKIKLWESGYYK